MGAKKGFSTTSVQLPMYAHTLLLKVMESDKRYSILSDFWEDAASSYLEKVEKQLGLKK